MECLQLECPDRCFKFHCFFSFIYANRVSELCSVKLFLKIFQLDIYILELLFSVKKM